MAYTKFSAFNKVPYLLGTDFLVGYRPNGDNIKTSFADILKQLELDTEMAGGQPVDFTGTQLPNINNNTGQPLVTGDWTILTEGTFQNIGGGAPIVFAQNTWGTAVFNGTSWEKRRTNVLPNNASKISEWAAGTYQKDAAVTYGGKIYRANKTTTMTPANTAGVPTADWDRIGGGELDVVDGALSYERGLVIELVLKYFLTQGSLTPGSTFEINKTTAAFSGVTPLENTGLFANGQTFGYDQDFRVWTYLNAPITQPDGRKIMTLRYQGPSYGDASMANMIGVRNDNTLVPLLVGSAGDKDVTVDVAGYKAVHLSMDAETSASNPRITVTFSQETDAGAEEDAVKKYIDNKVKIVDWQAGSYAKDTLKTFDGLIYRANKTTSQQPSQGSSDWDVIGGGKTTYVLTEEYDSTDYGIPVEGEFIRSTDFIRVVAGMKIEARGYGDGVRPMVELYDDNKANPVTLMSYEGMNATQPTDFATTITSDGYIKAYNNTWQSGTNFFVKLYNVEELTREDIDKPKGVASYESVKQIYDNKGGEPNVKNSILAGGFNVPDGEYWRWTPPIPVKEGDLIQGKGRGDAGVWSIIFSEDAGITPEAVNGATVVYESLANFATMGGLDSFTARAPRDGYIVGRSNLFFGSPLDSEIIISTDDLFVKYADIQDILNNADAGGSRNKAELVEVPRPTKIIRLDFKSGQGIPTADEQLVQGTISYNDNDGNTFTKHATIEWQGSSSVAYVKKNFSFAFYNDAALEEPSRIRIGSLVPHDELVFKSNYIDATHSRNIVCNRIWEDMIQARSGMFKRENERAKGFNPTNGTLIDRFDSGALCHVEGFPAVLYIDGEFYGIGNLNIGKKKDNYDIASNNQNQIQLAADDHANFNVYQGEPVWEIRRPKSPDANFVTKVNAWFNSNALTGTAWKDAFPTNHDLLNCIDYMLLIDFLYAYDCFAKNFILTSWDGVKFFFTPYDLDSTLGLSWEGRTQTPWNESCRSTGGTAASQQFYQKLYTQFNAEVKARYAELKAKNVLTLDNVYRHLDVFGKTFGLELYEQEFAKWPNIPSNNPNATGNPYGQGGFYSSRMQILNWVQNKITWMDLPTNYGA